MKAYGNREITEAVLADYETAPIDAKLKMTLGFLRKLTLTPEQVDRDDLAPLLEAGVSREAITDAIYVCYLFNVLTRLADTLGWDVPSSASFAASADYLLRRGYR